MFEVTQDEKHVSVTVKLKKRVLAKEKKVYVYSHDALKEAKKVFPKAMIAEKAEQDSVASNVSGPHEATWKFPLVKEVEVKASNEEKPLEQVEEKKDLKNESRRARLEKLRAKKEHSSEEE